MRCRLCGYEFEPAALPCHSACPMSRHCQLICCPQCGYQMVDESKSRLASLLRWLWPLGGNGAGRRHDARQEVDRPHARLADVPVGREVEVLDLDTMPPSRQARLSVFGLAPGSRVRLLQRRPAPVIRIRETELALSQQILEQIRVRPEGNGDQCGGQG